MFFVTNLDSGGLENYLLRFLTLYANRFDEITIFCKGGKGGVLEADFDQISNVTIYKEKVGNFHPYHYFRLKRWLAAYDDATICDFTGNFAGPVLWAGKKAGISKRIVFYRSSSNRFRENRVRLLINKIYNTLVFRYATNILANSEFAFRFFFKDKQIDARFRVIYNGLDFKKFLSVKDNLRSELNIGDNVFVVGHTGRFNPAKNHKVILDVASNILASRPNVAFILCGKGVKSNLQPLIDNDEKYRRHSENIFLFENRSDISRFLNTCDAYIFPSLTEGQPNSLIEAWSKGLPFVASDIPPIKEITKPEFWSYLESPYNTERISSRLSSLIDVGFTETQKSDLRNWAKATFDSELRFNEFYRELID